MAIISLTTIVFSHPLISIDIKNNRPKQGEAIWIKIKSSKTISSGTITLHKKKFKLFKEGC